MSAWISLGGNRGNSLTLMERALRRLRDHPRLHLFAISPYYLTEPVGPVRVQSWFLNAVVACHSRMGPRALLTLLLRIETASGRNRQRERRWGPRPLDLDLLFFGDRVIRSTRLMLPHPRLCSRRFVLQPMADLAPGWLHPLCGKTIDTLLKEVDDTARIIRLKRWAWTPDKGTSLGAATLNAIRRMRTTRTERFSGAFEPQPDGTPGSPTLGDRDGLP
ncbi:MAG: 2-amino-4-hydroxy-6-hydroxymethyldihydropteridine diphosphokinase [Magnetococcales bacterium]|nr:2-amino-4-hydroxy-6-hydroxymethyldihydropteridine diphosphokinase [Magnetococcales bacterium]